LIQNERSASKQASKQASELIPAIDRVHSHAKYGTGTNTVRQGTDLDERDKEGIKPNLLSFSSNVIKTKKYKKWQKSDGHHGQWIRPPTTMDYHTLRKQAK
jgi:hypothetical protein